MKLQIASDIHLEFPITLQKMPQIPVSSPDACLVLAGDIGYPAHDSYKQFLLEQAKKFAKVFVIAGNHEFYKAEYYSAKQQIAEICKLHPNLIFMDKTSVLMENNIRVLGCTLWSEIPKANELEVEYRLNDYRCITIKHPHEQQERKLRVQDTVAMYNDELAWLKKELKMAQEKQETVIVMTHHAPLMHGVCEARFLGQPHNCAFASDLPHLMGHNLHTWIFGHTHYTSSQFVHNTNVISNQQGYLHVQEQENKYNINLVLELQAYTPEQLENNSKATLEQQKIAQQAMAQEQQKNNGTCATQ